MQRLNLTTTACTRPTEKAGFLSREPIGSKGVQSSVYPVPGTGKENATRSLGGVFVSNGSASRVMTFPRVDQGNTNPLGEQRPTCPCSIKYRRALRVLPGDSGFWFRIPDIENRGPSFTGGRRVDSAHAAAGGVISSQFCSLALVLGIMMRTRNVVHSGLLLHSSLTLYPLPPPIVVHPLFWQRYFHFRPHYRICSTFTWRPALQGFVHVPAKHSVSRNPINQHGGGI